MLWVSKAGNPISSVKTSQWDHTRLIHLAFAASFFGEDWGSPLVVAEDHAWCHVEEQALAMLRGHLWCSEPGG